MPRLRALRQPRPQGRRASCANWARPRAGWLVGSQFVFSQHCKACRGYGFSEEKIEALKAWGVSDLFSPLERALLAYTDALVLAFGRVDEAIFDALREHLDDEAIIEFTYITMMYTMHAVISPCPAPRVRRPRRPDRRGRRPRADYVPAEPRPPDRVRHGSSRPDRGVVARPSRHDAVRPGAVR